MVHMNIFYRIDLEFCDLNREFWAKKEKRRCPKKCCDWWKFTGQSQNFTENLNGPYGPYEHILQDGSSNLGLKKWVLDESSKFRSSEKQWNSVFAPKIEDLSCRICSYGPYGPFRFSVKFWLWPVIFNQSQHFWENVTFSSYQEN